MGCAKFVASARNREERGRECESEGESERVRVRAGERHSGRQGGELEVSRTPTTPTRETVPPTHEEWCRRSHTWRIAPASNESGVVM